MTVEQQNGELHVCIYPDHFNKAIKRQHYNMPTAEVSPICMVWNISARLMGPPRGAWNHAWNHAGFSDKSRPEIAWNSCSRQVYPITLDARLIFHAITQLFSSNSRFHALKYVESRHHAFPFGGPLIWGNRAIRGWDLDIPKALIRACCSLDFISHTS